MSLQAENDDNVCSDNTVNDLIISVIKLRAPLWDMYNKSYKDNVMKKKIWQEIAYSLSMSEAFVKTRWKSLRDRYFKERRKMKTTSGQGAVAQPVWALYSSMEFLSGVVEPRKTTTNMSDRNQPSSSRTEILADLTLESSCDLTYSRNGRILATQNETDGTPVELLSPCGSVDSQLELSRPSSRDTLIAPADNELLDDPMEPGPSGKRPATSSQSLKNPKRNKVVHDPVEAAIINFCQSKQNTAPRTDLNAEEHFYLSVAHDVAKFNLVSRIRMRQAVLRAFIDIMGEQLEDTEEL